MSVPVLKAIRIACHDPLQCQIIKVEEMTEVEKPKI
jgi:hypothetical protein